MRRSLIIVVLLLAIVSAAIGWLRIQPDPPALSSTPRIDALTTNPLPGEGTDTSAPAVASVETVQERVDDTEDCPRKPSLYFAGQSEEEHKAWAIELADTLAASTDADYLVAAALLSQHQDADRPLELLARAAELAPENRLVTWNSLVNCPNGRGFRCDHESIEAKAIALDNSNGAVWTEIAMRRVEEGSESEAIAAARRAIAAPRIDSYFIEHVIVLQRALASRNDLSYRQRYFAAMGYVAALAAPYLRVTRHCRTAEKNVGVWIELCDRLGARMFADGRTLTDQAIGRALQKIAAGRSGDANWIEQANADYEAFNVHYGLLDRDQTVQALVENDEAVLRQYVENFETYGEFEAQARLRAEAQRLLDDPDYDRCNFVSVRVNQ